MKKLILLICMLLFSGYSFAQIGSSGLSDAKTTGMAGTYNTIAKGSYAIGINPANIISEYQGDLIFILPVPQMTLRAGTDFMTMDDINYYFGGVNGDARFLDENDKNSLNDKFKDGGSAAFGVNVNLISFTFNVPQISSTIGFSISDIFAGNFLIPQDAVELPLKGNELNRLYTTDDADFQSWWVRNYSLSYAREFKQKMFEKFTGGITVKLLHGFLYAGTERSDTYLRTLNNGNIEGGTDFLMRSSLSEDAGINYDFEEEDDREDNLGLFPAPAGSGFGFDLGVSAKLNELWSFSLALTDIGSITWKSRTARIYSRGDFVVNDLLSEEQRDSVLDIIDVKSEYTGSFTTGLPTALRMGTAYSFIDERDGIPGDLVVVFDYNQGFNEMPGNTVTPRFSIGGDWMPADWISLRMGFSAGGLSGFNWAAGLGFQTGVIEFNISTTDLASIPAPNSSKRFSVAVNSRWRFR